MANAAELRLLRYVQLQIRTGTRTLELPAHLLEHVGDETLREVRALCRLSGVTLTLVRA